MRCILFYLLIVIYFSECEMKTSPGDLKHKPLAHKTTLRARVTSTTTEVPKEPDDATVPPIYKAPNIIKVPEKLDIPRRKLSPDMIPIKTLEEWAEDIYQKLIMVEKQVVRQEEILKKFKDIKRETRNGTAIVEKAAAALDTLLERRARAAEAIGRQAEKLHTKKTEPPTTYTFDNSINLHKIKKMPEKPDPESGILTLPNNCSSIRKVAGKNMTHFGKGARVELDITSVKIAEEVFDCDYRVLPDVYWSEELLETFQQNYAQDALTDFQYFCSAKGFMRHYPAASWNTMFKLQLEEDDGDDDDDEEGGTADVYDCRLRPWYVAAGGAPRDILVLFDFSGSMNKSSNKVNAKQFTLTLLNALTDDDHVNVVAFFDKVFESLIDCFNDKLVPANHVNTAAFMTMLDIHINKNQTKFPFVLREAVKLLTRERHRTDKPRPCQQAIVLLSDSINENYTQIMRDIDPTGRIRVFVIWLHDVNGLRDNSYLYSEWLACSSDGYVSELVTASDVTEQVMQVLRVLERPLVHQRKERLRVFSDVYANLEDPRRSEFYWRTKENAEQKFRYGELRHNKNQFLAPNRRYHDYMRHQSLNTAGYYYEELELDYRLMISVSVPVFDDTRFENITKVLAEEKQRNATRTYPANRLLGVAGVDIPIEHLKFILPYYLLGPGGSMFIIDHRGNIVLHDNLKPVFDKDILRPGYRTVDLLELEQSAIEHEPRNYPKEWLEFRRAVVLDEPMGKRELDAKNIFDYGMRAFMEKREYYWKRVKEHYTVVVSLPKYNKRHAVPEGAFTQQLAQEAYNEPLKEIAVHPEWLYCKHVDENFNEVEFEVRHFVQRRKDEPNFKMENLHHRFSPLPPTLLEKTYMCNEELMARLCKEAIATQQWADEHQDPDAGRDCFGCELGSVTAFFASESGLTRWQQYQLASGYAAPPAGSEWARGPAEAWYRRAAAAPGSLVLHAPVTPVRKLRNSFEMPPSLKVRDRWFTAARTLGHPDKGMIGVAGFHFHPKHLEDVLKLITNRPCPESEEECEPRCDGENWACVLVDEGGWIVAGRMYDQEELTEERPVREHLATAYPKVMFALLRDKIFTLHWIHDYQGICFPPEEEVVVRKSATTIIPSILKSMWRSVSILLHATRELITVVALISTGAPVAGETTGEKEKRRWRIWKDWQREKFERLWDPRVEINRTRIAACDRSRPLYVLQNTTKSMELLRRPSKNCSWPVSGVSVPGTNLLLLAINILCDLTTDRLVVDPLVNIQFPKLEGPEWETMTSAARLACWRYRTPLPLRPRHSACFPHNYTDEVGYRQCGPWLPDPEEPEAQGLFSGHSTIITSNYLVLLLIVICSNLGINFIMIVKL